MVRPTLTLTTQPSNRIATAGSKIAVDPPEMEPRESDTEEVGSADTRLIADIKIADVTETEGAKVFVMNVDVSLSQAAFPDTIGPVSLAASRAEYYQAMISAFAKAVVSELEK